MPEVENAEQQNVDQENQETQQESQSEVKLTFDPDKFKEDDNFVQWKENYKKEQWKAAREIAIKEKRDELGLQFEGKTIDNLLSAYADKVKQDAKIEPNKKVQELSTDMQKLRDQLSERENAINELKDMLHQTKFQNTLENKLRSTVSELNAELVIPVNDIMELYKNRNKVKADEDGNPLVLNPETGEPYKDNLMNPIPLESHFKDFALQYVSKPKGGRNEGDAPEVRENSLESFNKEMSDNGITQGSQKYNEEMIKRIKEGTLKM